MSWLDKFKDLMTVPPEVDEEEEALEMEEPEFEIEEEKPQKRERVTSFPSSSRRGQAYPTTPGSQVVLVKPERFDDAPGVGDHLNQKKTVVLNLESANKETARRIIDFLSGVAYANQGQIKRVANNTFIITPSNVNVMGDLILDELEKGSMYL